MTENQDEREYVLTIKMRSDGILETNRHLRGFTTSDVVTFLEMEKQRLIGLMLDRQHNG